MGGILLIAIFWFTREYKWYQAVLVGGWNFLFGIPIQYAGIFAILPIALYNGKKGTEHRILLLLILSCTSVDIIWDITNDRHRSVTYRKRGNVL